MSYLTRLLPTALTAVCLWLPVTPVLAQQANAEGPASQVQDPNVEANAPEAETGLQEIVVTAQRREETLQRAATALTAITGDSLRLADVSTPGGLTALVPSLQVADAVGPYSFFYLRGVGSIAGNVFQDAAVATNVDGVYIGRPSASDGLFYDMERVEVLKGPQGTLYGRNATGGAINVISKKPVLGEFTADVSAEYGNFSSIRADAVLNAPLGDKAALRAAVFHVQHQPYMNDNTDDQDDTGGRLSFLVDPLDTLRVVVVGDYFRQEGAGAGHTIIADNIFGNQVSQLPGPNFVLADRVGLASPQAAAFITEQPNFLLGRTFAPIPQADYLNDHDWGVSSTVDWSLPFGTVTVIPAHRESHVDYFSIFALGLRELANDKQSSVEFRVASNDTHPLRYLLGAYYFDESDNVPQFNNFLQASQEFESIYTGTISKAEFGRLTYAVTDALRLNGGVRYTREDKSFNGTEGANVRICVFGFLACPDASPFSYGNTSVVPPNYVPGADGTITTLGQIDNTGANAKFASYGRTTYRLGLDWDVSDHNMMYASYETGFKAGGFYATTDSGPNAGTFKPESIRAATVGSKNRFLGNRLQLNLEAYYWKYNDQQFSHTSEDSNGNSTFATENIGKATIKGVELDTEFLLAVNTLLSTDIQYNDAIYDSFVYHTANTNNGLTNGTGCPSVSVSALVYTVNCSDFRPPYAPLWNADASIEQTFPLPNGGKLVGNARVHWQTTEFVGVTFLPADMQRTYATADFGITYSAQHDRYYLTGFVNNASDRTIVAYTQPAPFSEFMVGSLRPPRTYGIRGGVHFQ